MISASAASVSSPGLAVQTARASEFLTTPSAGLVSSTLTFRAKVDKKGT